MLKQSVTHVNGVCGVGLSLVGGCSWVRGDVLASDRAGIVSLTHRRCAWRERELIPVFSAAEAFCQKILPDTDITRR